MSWFTLIMIVGASFNDSVPHTTVLPGAYSEQQCRETAARLQTEATREINETFMGNRRHVITLCIPRGL